jgi:hypothetical protein
LPLIDEKAHRHQFDASSINWLHPHDPVALIVGQLFGTWSAFGVHQMRDAGAIDVGIHEPHAATEGMQAAGEPCSDGAFTDATLATAHGNDIVDIESNSTAGVATANGGMDFNTGLKFRGGELDALTDSSFQLFGFGVGRRGQFDPDTGIGAIYEGVADHSQVAQGPLGAWFCDVGYQNPQLFGCRHGAFDLLKK